jgi:Cys-rich repeat protein
VLKAEEGGTMLRMKRGTVAAVVAAVSLAVLLMPGLLRAELGEWAWMGGSHQINQAGVYGIKGVPDAANVPGARRGSISWTDSDGNLWLFGGTGVDSTGQPAGMLNDLWRYDLDTSMWIWVSGSNTRNQPGACSSGTANVPGARNHAASWVDSSDNLWLFGGYGIDCGGWYDALNDLWRYDITLDVWEMMSGAKCVTQTEWAGVCGTRGVPDEDNVPHARIQSVSWTDSDGKLWLYGGFFHDFHEDEMYTFNDLWRYDPVDGMWTWMSGQCAAGKQGFFGSVSWADSADNLWRFGGHNGEWYELEQLSNELRRYDPVGNAWVLISGDSYESNGVYGEKGLPHPDNIPCGRYSSVSWTDTTGNFWLFGGKGVISGYVWNETAYPLNDLWRYDPVSDMWVWMSGADTYNQPGAYGEKGVSHADNVPGARISSISWIDRNGSLWLFGGEGYDSAGSYGLLNDLWSYEVPQSVECFEDGDCPEGEICNVETGSCVECVSDTDCDGDWEVCFNGSCYQTGVSVCEQNTDCIAEDWCQQGVCRPMNCTDDFECGEGWVCYGPECRPFGAQCDTNEECAPGYDCVDWMCQLEACLSDEDCDDGISCNGEETCDTGTCVAGTSPCGEGTYCDEGSDSCVECLENSHCAGDDLYCTGTPVCTVGVCGLSGDPCGAGTYCDEDSDDCVECLENSNCDDGIACNGAETCADGACVAGISPCGAGEYCDESGDACVECLENSHCPDDSLYCTGTPLCASGICGFSGDPCGDATPVCDEAGGRCVECLADADCDDYCVANVCVACRNDADCSDGQFCSGMETCASGACVFGTSPCGGGTPVCDETGDRCVECLNDTNCPAGHRCSVNACVPAGVVRVDKMTVKAGKTDGTDSIKFSGWMDATADDFMAALNGEVVVMIEAGGIPDPDETTFRFPVTGGTFSSGKYKSPRDSLALFSFDTGSGTMKFSVKDVDLTGLSCPVTVKVAVSAYIAQVELGEDMVNGTKKTSPLPLMMGVEDILTVARAKAKKGRRDGSDAVLIKGGFAAAGVLDMDQGVFITLGPDTFNVPGDQFTLSKGRYSCTKAESGNGLVTAKFDSLKCTYSIKIRNAVISGSGNIAFGIDVFGNPLQAAQPITLPPAF